MVGGSGNLVVGLAWNSAVVGGGKWWRQWWCSVADNPSASKRRGPWLACGPVLSSPVCPSVCSAQRGVHAAAPDELWHWPMATVPQRMARADESELALLVTLA